jgi:hypothetical protein
LKARLSTALRWYARQPRRRRAALRALPITAVTYGTALIAGLVAESLDIKGFWEFAFVTGAIVAFVGVVVVVAQALLAVAEEVEAEGVRQRKVLASAYAFADGWMLDDLQMLAAVRTGSKEPVVLAPADPTTALRRLVQSAYDALTAQYGQAERMDERIDFEVTFMTKSYDDGEITIPAWANRDGRKPTSMQQRTNNPRIYDTTVTADIYRAEQPGMRIVEDTADPQAQYQELYPRQKQRIKSSVIYPVLSSDYELLGTLVLHCDRPGFFAEGDHKFWREFCEIFAKPIALERQLLDHAIVPTGDEVLGAGEWEHPPF